MVSRLRVAGTIIVVFLQGIGAAVYGAYRVFIELWTKDH